MSCANADTPSRQLSASEARGAVRCLINSARGGRRDLALHKKLNGPARRHSGTMLSQECLLHVCAGEPTLKRRLRKYRAGAGRWRFAEVIALNGAGASPREVVRQWTTSPIHLELILGRFKHLGVGLATGAGLTFYTADLGWKN